MADRVMITGASGFVGSAVVRAAVQRGFDVRALVRSSSLLTNLSGLDCEIVQGDMRDAASMSGALRDVRFLFHVAADYRLWARDPMEVYRNNLEGTRVTMDAARNRGVEKIVYTSSVATLKPHSGGVADETARLEESDAVGAYKRSKVAAERLVESMAEQGLPVVIVNPSTPIGPRDIRPTPTGRVIIEAAAGRMPAFVETGLNLVHVDDVADGHMLALERGQVNQSYILGGQNATLKEMLTVIASLVARKAPKLKLPRLPLFPLAYAAEAVARATGKEPFITADGLRMAKHRMFFTSAKAERALGYRTRPFSNGLEEAILWFKQSGYLR